ncbi:MAG: PIN domain-containing protein [Anaerolineae bacterium]
MTERIFWDTAAFVALANQDDDLHRTAVEVSKQMARARAKIVTTDAVLTEVANMFSRPAWRPMAQRIIEALHHSQRTGSAHLIHVDEDLWQRGWRLFQARTDKEWSLTDCISFVVMQDNKLSRAFTSDHHFEQAGFVRLITTLDRGR